MVSQLFLGQYSFQIESFQTIMFFLMISNKNQFEEFQVSYK